MFPFAQRLPMSRDVEPVTVKVRPATLVTTKAKCLINHNSTHVTRPIPAKFEHLF
jgi:hypothetical protein